MDKETILKYKGYKALLTLNPKDNTTRAEIAVILERFVEKIKTK